MWARRRPAIVVVVVCAAARRTATTAAVRDAPLIIITPLLLLPRRGIARCTLHPLLRFCCYHHTRGTCASARACVWRRTAERPRLARILGLS